MGTKYKIGECVYHRIGDNVSYGKIVGYEDGCYVIETPVDGVLGYMRLTDEDISRNCQELIKP